MHHTAGKRSILDPYLAHLLARHAAGCENAEQLWREIRCLGYSGTQKQVRRWLQERRRHPAPTTPHQYRHYRREIAADDARNGTRNASTAHHTAAHRSTTPLLPSPTQLAWLLVRPPESLSESEMWTVRHVMQDGEVARVAALVQRFTTLLRDRTADLRVTHAAFDAWLDDALSCGVRTVAMFARGLEHDGERRPAGWAVLGDALEHLIDELIPKGSLVEAAGQVQGYAWQTKMLQGCTYARRLRAT